MKIGLVSDIHARPQPLREALNLFSREQVDEIFCLGDIAGYFDGLQPCIELLQQFGCKTILGNHDESWLQSTAQNDPSVEYLKKLARFMRMQLAGIELYMVHAEPPEATHGGIKLLDQHGEVIAANKTEWMQKLDHFSARVLIVGHTHQVFAEPLGDLLVINPGSTAFNHSCMILHLPECQLETFALEQKTIVKSWNFGRMFGSSEPYPVAQ